jgi:capsular exopolysaccharide synthesis family protein
MSHIFDALQRSEAEKSGVDVSSLAEPTEMLRRAERRAASKWEGAAVLDEPAVAVAPERDRPLLTVVETQPAPPSKAVEPEPALSGDGSDIFSRFRALSVELPAQSRLVSLAQSGSPAAEAFRLLAVRVRHMRRDRPLKRVLVTSTIPEEGKSMVSANLACTLALTTKQKTLLLEGDVRRPTFSRVFGLEKNPGLCDWLQGESGLASSVYFLSEPRLWFMPAGNIADNPLELLQSKRLSGLLDQLAGWFDWIVIDSPPVLPLADTSVWSRMADGILLVARQGTTEKKQLRRGLEAIEPKKLIGAVLNSSRTAAESDYYYRPQPPAAGADNQSK